jgi:metal transporter CNNM
LSCPAPSQSKVSSRLETMTELWLSLLVSAGLLTLSALFSGLTLGLMGLDLYGLEIAIAGASPQQRHYASRILPLRKHGNLLLCTLLLGNVAVNSALSIALADITGGTSGFLVSTFVIVTIGEIMPQAICTRHALRVGSATVKLVWFFIGLLFVVAFPLSKMLDQLLGRELGTIYGRQELKKLIEIHENATIKRDEANIMSGALQFGEKKVHEIMRTIDKVFMLDVSQVLDFDTMTEIFKSGYSRIPVYDPSVPHNKIVGIIFVKDLIVIDPDDCVPVITIINFYSRGVYHVFEDCTLQQLFKDFKSGLYHFAVVQRVNNDGPGDPFYENVGIVTLEDVVEVIIQDQIFDETDVYVNIGDGVDSPRRSPYDVEKLITAFDSRFQSSNHMSDDEQLAIFYHLRGTYPELASLNAADVKDVISSSHVVSVRVEEPDRARVMTFADKMKRETEFRDRINVDVADGGVALYRSGTESKYFTLILDGRAQVESGKSHFRADIGRWQVLGIDLLELLTSKASRDEPFIPDFSAYVIKNSRLLRIHRDALMQALEKGAVTASMTPDGNPRAVEVSSFDVDSTDVVVQPIEEESGSKAIEGESDS